MGLFSKSKGDEDFDVEASQPPLVTATPLPVDYAAASLPTPAQAAASANIAAAAAKSKFAAAAAPSAPLQPKAFPLGRHPINVHCPHCQGDHVTRTSTYPGWETWVLCGVTALIFWPAFWVPLVVDTLKTTEHVCGGCGVAVGQVKPLTDCCVKERG